MNKDKENMKKVMNDDDKIPKSPSNNNTFKEFNEICQDYFVELVQISKSEKEKLSEIDILVINDLIHEIEEYSNILLRDNYIQPAKIIINIGLVITDFFLKIYGRMSGLSKNYEVNDSKTDILKYPLSLKLLLLKANFNILINYENDYHNGEKNLNEIIEIQKFLKSSNYHLASSKYHMAKIKYNNKNYDEAEKYAIEAKKLLENASDRNNKNNNEKDADTEKKVTQNVSNILSLLAQIYLIKKEFQEAEKCYENGYYLNLGRFGAENELTLFFKNKMELMNEELKLLNSQQPKTKVTVNQNNHGNHNLDNYGKMNFIGNIMHKGKADTFSFKIPTSLLYEPFLISVYSIGNDDNNRYTPELFLGNVCFDKQKLAKYLRLKGNNYNPMFYTDDNLNNILGNIMYYNGALFFLDKNLRNCLINSSCPLGKNNY